ncbi:MAG: hypothetical protein DME33_01715 [Verrucomicrobia bacterium]|nr:MAG: hypothetical protein DME33_01715 [Verrucomicrobiota bacterium]
MMNAKLITNSEGCGSLSPERRDIANKGCAKVERVVLNALQKTAALPPDICAFGGPTPIVFREADPPWVRGRYPLTTPEAATLIRHCFRLRHLVIPSSLEIRHSSFYWRMSVPIPLRRS